MWALHREARGDLPDEAAARRIAAHPHLHPWRLVDAGVAVKTDGIGTFQELAARALDALTDRP